MKYFKQDTIPLVDGMLYGAGGYTGTSWVSANASIKVDNGKPTKDNGPRAVAILYTIVQ